MSCQESTEKNSNAKMINQSKKIVKNQDVLINYDICGTGEFTVLLVHGWCINQTYWEEQVDAFCQDFRVVTFDLPGFGESGNNRKEWTVENYAKDIDALITQLHLKKVILVGHSMGGNIVLEAALKNEAVVALVGIDNFKQVGMEYTDALKKEMTDFVDLLKSDYAGIAPVYAANALFHPNTDSLVKQRVMMDFKTADSEIAISTLASYFDNLPNEKTQLTKWKKPFYLLNSSNTPTDTATLAGIGLDYKVVYIEETGHYPMIEKPVVFNRLLKGILSEIVLKTN